MYRAVHRPDMPRMSFLLPLQQIATSLVVSNSTHSLSCTYGGHKSKIHFTRLKTKVSGGPVSSGGSREESVFSPFLGF